MAEKGVIKIFRRKLFVSQCRKLSQGNSIMLCFRKSPRAKKFMNKSWGYQYFQSKTFCLTVPNSFAGEPFSAVFQQTSGSEKVMD